MKIIITIISVLFLFICCDNVNTLLDKKVSIENQIEYQKTQLSALKKNLFSISNASSEDIRKIQNQIDATYHKIDILSKELDSVHERLKIAVANNLPYNPNKE